MICAVRIIRDQVITAIIDGATIEITGTSDIGYHDITITRTKNANISWKTISTYKL